MPVFQPQMFGEETDLPEHVIYYLKASLRSTVGSDDRWSQARATGLDDAALMSAISDIYGIFGGYSTPGVKGSGEHKGGANPVFRWYEVELIGDEISGYDVRTLDELVFKGKLLVDTVRRVLEIPEPY